jgi:CubicO group peptidase (beta-lactamase class C family)
MHARDVQGVSIIREGAMDQERLASVDGFLRARLEEHHIPALSVAIVQNGAILMADAYGLANLEWNVAATPDTMFQLASVTKLFTATLLMALVEDGEIRLGAPVPEYLPESPASWRAITVEHLASHTSGIPDDVGSVASVEEAVAAAARLPLESEPGEKVRYGLLDFTVLTHVLQTVTGKGFQALLRDRLLTPLDMVSTRFDNMAELPDHPVRVSDVLPRRASVYEWVGEAQRTYAFLFADWTYSAGGLYSSAADIARWAAALDSGEFLADESMRRMWTRQRLSGGGEGAFGGGWIVDEHGGRKVTGHSGGPALADIVRFPEERLTIAVLTNQQNLRPYLAMGVADLLVREA